MNLEAATALTAEELRLKPTEAPPTPETIAPLFPQLEILEYLGRGGMGIVYKARQRALDRIVALKILAPERECDAEFAERFAREAQALARLSHPHIVTIHDFGEVKTEEGRTFFYLLMEFVDGVNLRQILRSRRLAPEEALAIVPTICDALQYAHSRGIVHRDIKPENLLLDKEGKVKIADFGIAKIVGADAAIETGSAGTPEYMAPEQKSAPERVDHRADIYSLGVVLYEMLTGELPSTKLEAPSSRVTGVQFDVRLDEIVLRALHAQPELRYHTALDLKTQIESMTEMRPTSDSSRSASVGASRRHSKVNTANKTTRRGSRHFAPALIALLVATATITLFSQCKYYAKVTMEVQQEKAPYLERPWSAGELYQGFITEQRRELRAYETIEKVIERLGLPSSSARDREKLTAAISRTVELRTVRNTDLLELGVYNSDPKLAADIANTLAEVYQDQRKAKIERALEKLASAVEQERKRMQQAALRRDEIRDRDRIADANPESLETRAERSTDVTIAELEKRRADQQRVVEKLQKQISAIGNLEPLEIRQVLQTLEIADPVIEETFKSLNKALAEQVRLASAGLGDKHPQFIAISALIAEYSRQLTQTLESVRQNRLANLKTEQRALDDLQTKLAAAKTAPSSGAKTNVQPYLDAKLQYLQSKKVFEAASAKLESEKSRIDFFPVRIWERADPPPYRSWPPLRLL